MKIVQLVCSWPPYRGGMGQSAYTIEQILKQKYSVTTYTPYNITPWLKYGHGAFLPQLLWKLKRFDYIYLHYPFFGVDGIIYLFSLLHPNKKLIIHYHMDVINYSWITRILSLPSLIIKPLLFKRANTIISASLDYVKHSSIKNIYKKYPHKFREVPFGLDTDLYKPRLLKQESDNRMISKTKEIINYINDKYIRKEKLRILFVGGLDKAHYFKGLEVLIESLFLSNKKWSLQIIGSGDRKKYYESLVIKKGLNKKITFLGDLEIPELIRTMQHNDTLILPSINNNEAFGLVLIEAMSCGLPVIASNLPGVRKVFVNYQQGLIVDVNSPEDLKEKIEYIIDNEDFRKNMSRKARKLAIQKYSLEVMKNKLYKIFI